MIFVFLRKVSFLLIDKKAFEARLIKYCDLKKELKVDVINPINFNFEKFNNLSIT